MHMPQQQEMKNEKGKKNVETKYKHTIIWNVSLEFLLFFFFFLFYKMPF